MRHVFKATKIGWDEEQEGVWFDSDFYSKEEAEAEFKPYREPHNAATHILVTNTMESNITM